MLTYLQKLVELGGFCLGRIELIHHGLSDGLLAFHNTLRGEVVFIIAGFKFVFCLTHHDLRYLLSTLLANLLGAVSLFWLLLADYSSQLLLALVCETGRHYFISRG